LDHHPFQKACANYLTLELTRPQGNTRAWCQMRRCHPRVPQADISPQASLTSKV